MAMTPAASSAAFVSISPSDCAPPEALLCEFPAAEGTLRAPEAGSARPKPELGASPVTLSRRRSLQCLSVLTHRVGCLWALTMDPTHVVLQ